MARKREEVQEEKFLDVNAAMQGSLVFSDPVNLRISGKFEGDLTTRGNLVVGRDAKVAADIIGENITIAGRVKGKIKATKLIAVAATGEITGDIETPRLSMETGAVFNGICKMVQAKMSISELSDYLSVKEDKIMEWVSSGEIPAERSGAGLLFDHREVETWLGQSA